MTWKSAAIPAALVFGYSSAIVTSLTFGHVSVTLLVIPPFLFTTLYEIVVRQEHSVTRDGLLLAVLLIVQFFISPEILVMCLGSGRGRIGGSRARGLAAAEAARLARRARPGAGRRPDVSGAGVSDLVRIGRAAVGFRVCSRVGPDLGHSAVRVVGPRAVRDACQCVHPLRRVPRPHRPAARLRRRRGGRGCRRVRDHRQAPVAHLAPPPPGGGHVLVGARRVPVRRAVVAWTPVVAMAQPLHGADPQGNPAGSVRAPADIVPGLPARGRTRSPTRPAGVRPRGRRRIDAP